MKKVDAHGEGSPGGLPRALLTRGLLAAWLLLAGAVSPALSRGEWYDYYEGALRALQSGEHQRAIELLEDALARKKRSGYFRTYGNNYLRYVPHFYLGVAFHDAGDCERSLESFERSEAVNETEPVPELAARMRSLRTACEARLAPPERASLPVEEAPARSAAREAEESSAGAPAVPPSPTAETGTVDQGIETDSGPSEAGGSTVSPAAAGTTTPRPSRTAAPPVIDADPEILESGLRAYLRGDLETAIRTFGDLARTSPQSARLHLLLGMALHSSWVIGGESDESLFERSRRELSEAARLDPRLAPDPALCPPRVVALHRSLR